MRLEKLGPYKLDRQLGQGGMGTVYAGVHETTGQVAAVKVLSSLLGTNKNFRVRFDAEIETLKKLKHPHIVQLYGYGEQDGHLFYAMELVEGRSLQDELRAGRQFMWRDVVRYGIEMCAALKHAHDSGVIHRDLKPANLLLTPDGHVKLTDFGIAKLFGSTQLTVDGGIVGTADYMSPEQAEGKPVTARCDLYSLGSVLYALLSRRPPFTGRSLTQVLHALRFDAPVPIRRLAPDTPEELEAIISQLLEKDAAKRIPTALVLGNRLKALEHALSQPESPPPPTAEPNDDYQLADDSQKQKPAKTQPGISAPSQPTRVTTDGGDAAVNDALTWDQATQASPPSEPPRSRRTEVDGLVSVASRFTTVSEDELSRAHLPATGPDGGLPAWLKTLAVVLITALLAAVLWFIARPPSADALYQTITTAARDGSIAKLKEAENDIDRFLSSYPSDPRRDEIAGYQQDIAASRKALTFDLKTRRTSNAQTLSPAELTYFEATQLAATDPESAAVKLQAIIDVFGGAVDDSAETKKAVELARTQIEQLQKAIETQRPKHLAAIHKQLDWAEQHRADDSAAAQAVCRGVIELYAGKPWAAAAVQRARKLLAKVVAVKDNDEAVDMKIVWVESTARARVAQIQWRGLPVDILAMTSLPDWSAEQWQRLFSVTTVSESLADPPPLLGDYRVDDRTVVFEPRFPLRPGVTYRAAFRAAGVPNFSSADIADLSREFSVPKLAVAAETVVTAIYPSGDVLPENLLRLYLHFSAPMSRGDAYARIRLLDESGRPVESPFLELGEELWNESQTRFTLLFDPGRIKRGLKPRELFGPALVEGQRYTLAIDREWPDAAGESLAAEATKSFAVIAPDDTQPDPQRWKLTPPAAETREPFVVNFDKPLDHAMLQRVLWITNSSQQPLAGTIAVAEQERRWSFVPRTAWQPGEYSLVIDTTLEDVAGNSIGRPFEVDVLRPASASDEPQTAVLKFRVE